MLAPLLLLAAHFGPGQTAMARDEAARRVALAAELAQVEDWQGAASAYSQALAKLPDTDRVLRWSLRLAWARARTRSGGLPEGLEDLDALLAEIQQQDAASPLIEHVRAELATAEYYAGWLMRLEGAEVEDWAAEVESARDRFRGLAMEKSSGGIPDTKEYRENLEAAVRLARMELSELRELPLPTFLQGSAKVSEKCRSRRRSDHSHPAAQTPGAK
ncbi:MAG: hypothetical protein WCF18_07895 [Chthoniobacteraceae bacterium]